MLQICILYTSCLVFVFDSGLFCDLVIVTSCPFSTFNDLPIFSQFIRACLKRRHVYVAVWLSGRSAEIIEKICKYYKNFKIL